MKYNIREVLMKLNDYQSHKSWHEKSILCILDVNNKWRILSESKEEEHQKTEQGVYNIIRALGSQERRDRRLQCLYYMRKSIEIKV